MKTIGALATEYTDHLQGLRYSPETLKKKREHLRRFALWLEVTFDVKTLDRLRPEHLKRWHRHLGRVTTATGQPLKPTGVNRHIISVRGLVKHLADDGYVPEKFLEALPYVKEPKRLPGRVLTHGQVKKFLAGIPTDRPEGYRNRAMFELLYSSGLRASELVRLNVEDLNFTHRTALVRGKGDKERVVPFGKTAARHLATYVKGVRPYLVQDNAEKALFLGMTGRRLSYLRFSLIVRKLADAADLPVHVTAHTFRRSCTTELIRGGANMYHVKELLGHETLHTLKHYVRLTITDLKKTHEKHHPRERERD